MIPRTSFANLCKEVLHDTPKLRSQPGPAIFCTDFRMSAEALAALQQMTEEIVTLFLSLANKAAIHAKRVTVTPRDMYFVKDFIQTLDPAHPLCQVNREPPQPAPARIPAKKIGKPKKIGKKGKEPVGRKKGQGKEPIRRKKGQAVTKRKQ